MDRTETDGCATPKRAESRTVEEELDRQIQRARANVERLCIAKAKLETLGMLKYPYNELVDLLHVF